MTAKGMQMSGEGRTLEKLDWQDVLVMPGTRKLDCPYYSMPMKKPGTGSTLEQMWNELRSKKVVGTKKKVVLEDLASLENKTAFVTKTAFKGQLAKLRHQIQLGMRVIDDDLEVKKNKLKDRILKEETNLVNEYVSKAQKLADQLLQEKQKKAESILEKITKENEEAAKAGYERWVRENSHELKSYLSKKLTLEVAEAQQYQICEKIRKKEMDEEYEKFWVDIMKKHDQQRKEFEELEETMRLTKVKEQRDVLNEQMEHKRLMLENLKKSKLEEGANIDKLRETFKEEEKREKELRELRRMEIKKMQLSHLEMQQDLKMRKAAEEKELDIIYCQNIADAIEKERLEQYDNRADLNREIQSFRQQLAEMNAAKKEEERICEGLRFKEVAKKEAKIKEQKELLEAAREKLQRETLESWKQQVLHKQRVLQAEKETNKLYDNWSQIMLEKNKELDKLQEKHKLVHEVALVDELASQNRYGQILQQRKVKEDNDFIKHQQEEQDLKDNEWIQFKSYPVSKHPFIRTEQKN